MTSWPHLTLISSPRPHLLIPSHWGVGFQYLNLGVGQKHSVHNMDYEQSCTNLFVDKCTPISSWVAASEGKWMFKFIRNCPTFFLSGSVDLCSHQYENFHIHPYACQHGLVSLFNFRCLVGILRLWFSIFNFFRNNEISIFADAYLLLNYLLWWSACSSLLPI